MLTAYDKADFFCPQKKDKYKMIRMVLKDEIKIIIMRRTRIRK